MSSSTTSMKDVSAQIKDFRSQLAGDEKTSLMMDALRGKNINDDDKQGVGIDMKVVEMKRNSNDINDVLPTFYDPKLLENYFNKRPGAVRTRLFQIVSASAGYVAGLCRDILTGNTEDIEVRRAAQLRNTIVSLGPFFIKLGQALSIRPDILSPRAMVELQQLCDKVPCFDNELAMATITEDLGRSPSELFSYISQDPVAAASLGQVYRATLAATGDDVAVKVQRPYVLETVSLDLHLARQLGLFLRNFPQFSNRLDIVSIIDEFSNNFYQELNYVNECANGIEVAEDMKKLPMVIIPRNFPDYTSRRVHIAQWVEGEKLSQSKANDVSALVNLGVITYLTQLLDTGFFHADPHPGNMLRSPDGKLVILDFGLMTRITDDQKYGMIEAIAHLIHRDYDEIGNDFVKLDFIPLGVDTRPIVPALARVFDAALSGGGAKSINFQELAADLAEITFKFPFKIPPYFALIIRAISVLEGIALVGNPEFAIVDEAYPYISKRLMTDDSPRLRAALKYMIYGKGKTLDVDRVIDMLQALEKFVAVKEFGDGSAFKTDGVRGGVYVGKGGDTVGSRKVDLGDSYEGSTIMNTGGTDGTIKDKETKSAVREAFKFFFSKDGLLFREFLLEEISNGVDAMSRDAVRELVIRLGVDDSILLPPFFRSLAPSLTEDDKKVVESITKLVGFFIGDTKPSGGSSSSSSASSSQKSSSSSYSNSSPSQMGPRSMLKYINSASSSPENRERLIKLYPILKEFAPEMRQYGLLIASRLVEKSISRVLKAAAGAIFGGVTSPRPVSTAAIAK